MSSEVKERKVSQSAPSKIDSIVRQLFLPMLSIPTPEYTSFLLEDGEDMLVYRIARDKPNVVGSEAEFIEYMLGLYQKFQAQFEKANLEKANLEKVNDCSVSADSVAACACAKQPETGV
jgi:hypothetical protein